MHRKYWKHTLLFPPHCMTLAQPAVLKNNYFRGFPLEIRASAFGEKMVREMGFEPTNPFGIRASVLRLWPCWATPAPFIDATAR